MRTAAKRFEAAGDGQAKDMRSAAKAASSRQKMTDAEQSAEFERVARKHGAEDDERAFSDAMQKLARPKARS